MNKTTMKEFKFHLIAIFILIFSLFLMLGATKNDSLIVDEIPHIGAGYSYLVKQDYRLNPEHPPLIKDLAAIPLLFLKLNFTEKSNAWIEKINGQWDFGREFIYASGNDADKITFWARLLPTLLTIIFGWLIYKWTSKNFGYYSGLLSLFFFAFSPTLLAHGKFVTTDVGAAFGFFIATVAFISFVKNPTIKSSVLAGFVFGVAQMLKFSTFLLVPLFIFLILVWLLINWHKSFNNLVEKEAKVNKKQFIALSFFLFFIGYFLILTVYLFHTWHYPIEKQIADIQYNLAGFSIKKMTNFVVWVSSKPILRAYGQYLHGLFMTFQRATGGNTTYFLGEVSNKGWHYYFPIVYLIKEPLTIHILTLIILIILIITKLKNYFSLKNIKKFIKNHFSEFTMLSAIAIYWISAIMSNLNIGVRHILPTFPFLYILISSQIVVLLNKIKGKKWLFQVGCALLLLLIIWQIISVVKTYPYFLAYFNELAGGPNKGYKYVVDSNLDWGQDLKRLAQFVEKNNIDKIYLDYFGWADPYYYLKNKYVPFSAGQPLPKEGWIAISATYYQNSLKTPDKAYRLILPEGSEITKIGYSIFIYHLP